MTKKAPKTKDATLGSLKNVPGSLKPKKKAKAAQAETQPVETAKTILREVNHKRLEQVRRSSSKKTLAEYLAKIGLDA